MRRYLLAACALACLVAAPTLAPAGVFDARGQFVGPASASIKALLGQFPSGGPGLRAAIARALEVDPSLADDVVFLARKANPAQKQAMGQGLADAASYFAKCGVDWCRAAEARIRTVLPYADDGTRLGFYLGDTPAFAGIPGVGNAGATTSGCASSVISPSKPGGSPTGTRC
jgi:hypothetical protein